MKLFALLALLFGMNAQAASAPAFLAPGAYRVTGEMELIQAKATQLVHLGFSEAGSKRIGELRADGYACENIYNGEFLCSKFLKDAGLPEELRARIRDAYAGMKLQVDPARGPMEEISLAPSLDEWRAPQAAEWQGLRYDDYRVQVLKESDGSTLTKIALGRLANGAAEDYLIVRDEKTLQYFVQADARDGRDAFTHYSVLILLK